MVELAGNKQKTQQEIALAQLVVQWLMNYENSHEKTGNLKPAPKQNKKNNNQKKSSM